MLRRLYDRIMQLAEGPQAMKWLAGVSFAESSFFPVPPDAMIVPMVLARPDRAWRIAMVCTIASVIGGFFGYAIGYFLYRRRSASRSSPSTACNSRSRSSSTSSRSGAVDHPDQGLTPIPYKLVTIASGVAHFDLLVFALASLVTRGARFFLVAALLKAFGPPLRTFIERLSDAGDDRPRCC